MCDKKCAYFITVLLALSLVAGLSGAATSPSPKDGATDVLRDGTILKWTPGAATAKFDVYFASNLQYVTQVERAAPVYVQASLGQKTTTFNPGRLELGKTYYWRVDEVNDVDPNAVTVTKGDVWSFIVETPVQQVVPIAATTSCSIYENMGPEKTIDGSGLVDGKHSASMEDMWLSCSPVPEPIASSDPNSPVGEPIDPNDPNSPVVTPPVVMVTPEVWIQYEFDRVQKLQQMQVWNWNSAAEKYFGLGVKDANILYSNNGTDWTTLGEFTFAAATGKDDYKYNTVIDFKGISAKFVRILMMSSQRGLNEYGLSEVQFFSYPVYSREPSPAPGKTGMALDATVNWRSGRDAGSHKVYISADKDAVAKGTAPSFSVNTNSFKLSSTELKLGSTYYWRVDEVNDTQATKSYAGDIWNFSTVDYLVLDNIESYTDKLSGGWGSPVHCLLAVEKTLAHTGKQSVAINYQNDGSQETWVAVTVTNKAQKNWTKNGIKYVLMFLRHDTLNTSVPIRPRINQAMALKPTGAVKGPWWSCWSFDTSGFTSVDSFTLTFNVPTGGKGKLYIDDLRLSCKLPPLAIVDQMLQLNGTGATKGQFDTLFAAVSAADPTILDLLSGEQTYTLFAPTDDAFAAAKISEKTDKAVLTDILRNNIVASLRSVASKGTVKTLEGSSLIQDANTVLDEAGGQAVITAGADASNGTILVSDTVLMPFQNVKLMDVLTAMNGDGDLKGQFDTLLAAIGAAKATVRDTLGKRSYTLFAPTDDAFAALGYDPDSIKKMDQGVLTDVLLYHLVSGRIMGKDLTDKITTVQGGVLKQSKGVLTDSIGGQAKITGFDVEGSNGVIHIIDAVVLPFAKTRLLDLVALVEALNTSGDLAGQFNTLIAVAEGADAAKVAPLLSAGAYTVFAPTDAGFAAVGIDAAAVKDQTKAFLTDLLLYHVASGSITAEAAKAAKDIKTVQGGVITLDPNDPNGVLVGAFAGKAKITTADIVASNGLVQVIDSGLLPYEPPAIVVPEAPKPVLVSITDTIIALNAAGDRKGQFDTFLAAAQAADPIVLQKLSGTDACTLFVPTDDACAALGLTADNVEAQDKLVLTDVLLYHIAAGKLLAADVLAATSITMVKGGSVQQADGVLTDNVGGQAKIVGQDIEASNGMIQVIDAVLLPAKL
jgi:transforming growth factor-beta-induced protein